jgi:hypothetical protein
VDGLHCRGGSKKAEHAWRFYVVPATPNRLPPAFVSDMKTDRPLACSCFLLFCLAAASPAFAASDRVVVNRSGTVLQAPLTGRVRPRGALTFLPSLLIRQEEPARSLITAQGIRQMISSSRGEGCNEGASDIYYQLTMRQSWAVSDAPDLETSLAFADFDDPLALTPVTPVAEASTWFAAALATLVVAWHARRILPRRRPTFVARCLSVLRRVASRITSFHGEANVSASISGH